MQHACRQLRGSLNTRKEREVGVAAVVVVVDERVKRECGDYHAIRDALEPVHHQRRSRSSATLSAVVWIYKSLKPLYVALNQIPHLDKRRPISTTPDMPDNSHQLSLTHTNYLYGSLLIFAASVVKGRHDLIHKAVHRIEI